MKILFVYCNGRCGIDKLIPYSIVSYFTYSKFTDNCSLEPEVGTCKGYIPRFFYNSTSNQCEEFIYGGCGGNGNNFLTIDECLQTCRKLILAGIWGVSIAFVEFQLLHKSEWMCAVIISTKTCLQVQENVQWKVRCIQLVPELVHSLVTM